MLLDGYIYFYLYFREIKWGNTSKHIFNWLYLRRLYDRCQQLEFILSEPLETAETVINWN